jgi:phosphodiesterase/alkaline phosphatase D-like protein
VCSSDLSAQQAWIKQQLQQPVVWRVLAGESPFVHMPIDMSSEPTLDPALRKTMLMSTDFWGGYKSQQADLVEFVRQQNLANVVSLAAGGMFSASEIWSDYSATERNPVMIECTTAPMSAPTLSEEIAAQLTRETDVRYAPLRNLFRQSYNIDTNLLEQLQGWLKTVNTGTRGFSMVYVLLGEMVIDFTRVSDLSNGQVQNVVAGRTRVTLKAGIRKIEISEY